MILLIMRRFDSLGEYHAFSAEHHLGLKSFEICPTYNTFPYVQSQPPQEALISGGVGFHLNASAVCTAWKVGKRGRSGPGSFMIG